VEPAPLISQERILVALSRWRVQLGFCLAIPALYFAHATPASFLVWLPCVVTGLALRTWARGHLDRAERVCTGGPYGSVRHPLYLGSLLMGLGVSLMALPWAFAPLFVLVFTAMYWPKAIREEAYLGERFGDAYATYAATVPAIWPRFGSRAAATGAPTRFEWRRVRRHHEWQTWVGVSAVLLYVWTRMA
jgi:protein-S-isoprenylcysteine O-methyltransferase Ste14